MASANLHEYLRAMCVGHPVIPQPPNEEWPGLIARLSPPGRVCEIDQEAYDWFLECLPPRTMFRGGYAFAEGAEPIRLFWTVQGTHYTRQLTWDETAEFCRFAGIGLPH